MGSGVLEERNACGRWAVGAVRALRAVGAGGAGGRKNTIFSSLFCEQ